MGKTNFQTLKNLIDSLSNKLNKLSDGALNLDEVESLTEDARELYERIVVIRYKSYESVNSTSSEPKKDDSEAIELSDKLDNAIEEVMTFDFSSNEEISNNPEIAENENEPNVDKALNEKPPIEDEKTDASLNDNFKKIDGSVGDQFEKAPITDLKAHIGINRKFLYINELFKGDSSQYNIIIEKLNSYTSSKEALEKVNKLAHENDWDVENTTVSGFIELVERRYLG